MDSLVPTDVIDGDRGSAFTTAAIRNVSSVLAQACQVPGSPCVQSSGKPEAAPVSARTPWAPRGTRGWEAARGLGSAQPRSPGRVEGLSTETQKERDHFGQGLGGGSVEDGCLSPSSGTNEWNIPNPG